MYDGLTIMFVYVCVCLYEKTWAHYTLCSVDVWQSYFFEDLTKGSP